MQETHNADPCLPANHQKTECQARVFHKHFQQSMIFRLLVQKNAHLHETWTIYGLDIALAAPRKGSSDSLDERRNRSKNDNLLST